jgi:hypothetical protein
MPATWSARWSWPILTTAETLVGSTFQTPRPATALRYSAWSWVIGTWRPSGWSTSIMRWSTAARVGAWSTFRSVPESHTER